jgi:hypothetical protein
MQSVATIAIVAANCVLEIIWLILIIVVEISLYLNCNTRSQYTNRVLYVKLSHDCAKGISMRSAEVRPVKMEEATRKLA